MESQSFQKISDSEMEIMQIIWSHTGAITSAQIQQKLSDTKEWKPTTVLTFLSRLVEKGLLRCEKVSKSNQYAPLISESEYKRLETKSFLQNVHNGSMKSFMAALCDETLTKAELDELKDWFSKL